MSHDTAGSIVMHLCKKTGFTVHAFGT